MIGTEEERKKYDKEALEVWDTCYKEVKEKLRMGGLTYEEATRLMRALNDKLRDTPDDSSGAFLHKSELRGMVGSMRQNVAGHSDGDRSEWLDKTYQRRCTASRRAATRWTSRCPRQTGRPRPSCSTSSGTW